MDRISINDIENTKYKKSMNNDNAPFKRMNSKEVDAKADRLVAKLRSPESRPFYCRCIYNLPEATIERLVVTACEKGNEPAKLFNWLARSEMGLL